MRSAVPSVLSLALVVLLSSCSDSPSSASTLLVADQQYYPVTPGSQWTYRIDSVGTSGVLVRDVERRTVRIGGTLRIADTAWTIQSTETTAGATTTRDTTYVRKSDIGLFFSSPALQAAGQLPGLFGGVSIPRELLVLPTAAREGDSWEIYRITFSLPNIPLLQYYIKVDADHLGTETVTTDRDVWRNCARIRMRVDILLPNPTDPTNILNPLRIRAEASFWFIRPFGLVMGDGSELVFRLVRGNPLAILQAIFAGSSTTGRRLHQEVLTMDVRQPDDPCVTRGGRY